MAMKHCSIFHIKLIAHKWGHLLFSDHYMDGMLQRVRKAIVFHHHKQSRSQSPRALSSGTGNRDLWDNQFQLEFSLVDHLSMSSRTRSQKVNKNGGKDSADRVFKLLLSVVNQIFCSWTPIWGLAKRLKEGEFAYSA